MRDTTRHIGPRRQPVSAHRTTMSASPMAHPSLTRAGRVDLLRRLVAAGQYQVNPKVLAHKIMAVAGAPALEE